MQSCIRWSNLGIKMELSEIFSDDFRKVILLSIGDGSLLTSSLKVSHESFIISDPNQSIVSLWNQIEFFPSYLIDSYAEHWQKMKSLSRKMDKKIYFNDILRHYNLWHLDDEFYFLTMCMKHEKGSSMANPIFKELGANPDEVEQMIASMHELINSIDKHSMLESYTKKHISANDLVLSDTCLGEDIQSKQSKLDWISNQNRWGMIIRKDDIPHLILPSHEHCEIGNGNMLIYNS